MEIRFMLESNVLNSSEAILEGIGAPGSGITPALEERGLLVDGAGASFLPPNLEATKIIMARATTTIAKILTFLLILFL